MKLSDLTQKRREHIQSCRDNNDNSHEIIAGLYSDPSHFIYELLQNADDAGASEIMFRLTSQALSIIHNGKKLFDYNDVDSITTVGSSTKKDDVNSIGTFGAGFKSVFAITKKPSIHSGDHHFQIVDLVIPEEIQPKNTEKQCTEIILPFNHPDISSDNAYNQISNRLKGLESESLLFLRNIKEIQWKTESDNGHYVSDIEGNRASLIAQVNDEDSAKEFLLITKDIEVDSVELEIVVAYRLDSDGKVIPVHDSKLFVFFPTNERTGLQFLVHAPYKTTPSRESIPFDDNQNQIITAALSDLVAKSIMGLKNSDLLSVDILSMLPIDSENNHPLYSSTFHKVKAILETELLLPTSNGDFTNASNAVLAREKDLTNLLDATDCTLLFSRKSWLSTEITSDKTRELRDYLTGELDIPEITMQKFCSEITEGFVETKSDKWIVEFYSSITKNKALYRSIGYPKGVLRQRPIIRLEDDSHICPENNSGELQVYLPPEGQTEFKVVKRGIAESEEALEFLESLGLKKPNNISEIKEFIIPKYQGLSVALNEYKEDFQRVFTLWSDADEFPKKEIIALLKQARFVRCIKQDESVTYQKPDDVYFPTDKLKGWFGDNPNDDIFFLDTNIELSKDCRRFLESLGVRYDLKMEGMQEIRVNSHGWYQRSVNGFNPDFNIHGLEFALSNITFERSVLQWSLLLKNSNKLKGYIETRTNQNRSYKKGKEQISQAMQCVSRYSWLYDRNKEIISLPTDQITLDALSDEYQKDDENVERFIKALGLKLDKVAKFEEETGQKVVSPEDYELLQQIKGKQEAQNNEDDWTPEVKPDDVDFTEEHADFPEHGSEDLSGQSVTGDNKNNLEENDNSDKDSDRSSNPRDKKAIGDWGEAVANSYLKKKYPSNEIVWLNEKGNVGKGYDFVIKENGEDIAYYEVKSKTDESPQLFQVSGTQWNWAKELHSSKQGDKYRLLLISNAGSKQPKIREISNPVECWKSGKLYADPVSIKL